jgi:hypothetical protein
MKIISKQSIAKFIYKHFSKINRSSDDILLFTHESARKYYKLNVPFLAGYLLISYNLLRHPDYPNYLKITSIIFSSLIGLSLLFINIYANRHINNIILKRATNELAITTFSKFGFSSRKYTISLSDLKQMSSIAKYIKTKQTGIYILRLKENKRIFRYLNVFFIRPVRNNPEFDRIFKKILI